MKELHEKSHQADELVTNRDVDRTPGKATQVDDAAVSQNLLSPEERADRVLDLKFRIVAAGARCNDAIQAVKIHTLLKKPADMPWVFGMLLDVAFTSLTASAVKALTKLKAGKIAGLGKVAGEAAFSGDTAALESADKRKAMFQAISDESIRARIGLVGGLAKNQARSIVAMTLADTQEKAETLTYLAQLQRSMDIAFQNLNEHGTKGLSDPELMVFFDAMDASHHSSEAYEHAITDKISRYMRSGVDAIGESRRVGAIEDPRRHHESIGDVEAERRVLWIEYPDKSKALWYYEKAESNTNARSHELAAEHGMDGKFRPTRIVPKEFWDEAIARCEETTGHPVETMGDSLATRALLGIPTHGPAKAGTIRSATNKIFGGK